MSEHKLKTISRYWDAVADGRKTFAVRKNEIFLFSKPRPIRSLHRAEGWTAETIASDLVPAFRSGFAPMERSTDVFGWDPV